MNRDATGLAGARHLSFDTLGSTNAEALARARAGERGPLWITARRQDAGRGRRGNAWVSPPGNLYATLLLTEPSPPAAAPQLAFVAALALYDALLFFGPMLLPIMSLKWPNDLLIGRSKIAGILIESENSPNFSIAVGIGVNCVTHPADTAFPASDLSEIGLRVTPKRLLVVLSATFGARLRQWQRGDGFAGIRADWLKRAAGLGEPIRVRLPERELSGRFAGLDEAGRLQVEQPDGIVSVTAGEVFGIGA
ncbi:MAG TPA: biotin--[acetyl-CoA-carboxylase] ligase [Pseudolabrys sp.]|nr:biotin--[acetyl-CoA-carboxylase] ligase [Pseudolabrys sp.]